MVYFGISTVIARLEAISAEKSRLLTWRAAIASYLAMTGFFFRYMRIPSIIQSFCHSSKGVAFGPGYPLQVLVSLRCTPGFTLLSLTQ